MIKTSTELSGSLLDPRGEGNRERAIQDASQSLMWLTHIIIIIIPSFTLLKFSERE